MKRRYTICFQYEATSYGFEGEEEYYLTSSKRYFDGYNAKEDFLQMLDMAGDEHTKVLYEDSVPMWFSKACYKLAKAVMVLGGYKYRSGANLFYWLLHKGLVDVTRDPMCEQFDHKGYSYR